MIRSILLIKALILIPFLSSVGQEYLPLIKKHFTVQDLEQANTAADVDYMNEIEKEIIQYLNLARTQPFNFSKFYIEYLKEFEVEGYKKFKRRDRYYYSLHKDLLKLKSSN